MEYSKEPIYYVYLLLDSRKYYLPFYIGKGKNKRWHIHLTENKQATENIRKWNKIQKMRREGFEPIVTFWEVNLDEESAYNIEEKLIGQFGRIDFDKDGILTNICESSRPPQFSKEAHTRSAKTQTGMKRSRSARKNMSNAQKGRKILWGDKISQATKGRTPWNKGLDKSDPRVALNGQKVGQSLQGKTQSEETIKKRSDALKGRKRSKKVRQNISNALKGKKFSINHRKNLSESHKGNTPGNKGKKRYQRTNGSYYFK